MPAEIAPEARSTGAHAQAGYRVSERDAGFRRYLEDVMNILGAEACSYVSDFDSRQAESAAGTEMIPTVDVHPPDFSYDNPSFGDVDPELVACLLNIPAEQLPTLSRLQLGLLAELALMQMMTGEASLQRVADRRGVGHSTISELYQRTKADMTGAGLGDSIPQTRQDPSKRQAVIALLHCRPDLSAQEIATLCGVSRETVRRIEHSIVHSADGEDAA